MSYWLDLITLVLILGSAATVIAYLAEEAGMIHAAGAALMGVGGYTSALATSRLDVPVLIGLALTLITGLVCGVVIHGLTRRLVAAYLALVTLGVAFVLQGLMINWVPLTGGPMGVANVAPLSKIRLLELLSCSAVAAITSVAARVLPQTRFGLRVRALRDDELLSQDLQLYPQRLRLALFVGSSCVLSLLGGLYAHHLRFLDPSTFALRESISILAMGLIAPISLPLRGLTGAAVFIFIPELLRLVGMPPTLGAQIRQGIFGGLLLMILWHRKFLSEPPITRGYSRA